MNRSDLRILGSFSIRIREAAGRTDLPECFVCARHERARNLVDRWPNLEVSGVRAFLKAAAEIPPSAITGLYSTKPEAAPETLSDWLARDFGE